MSLNTQDPEILTLAKRAVTYGDSVGLHEDRLRVIRYVLFDRPATMQSIKKKYVENGLSGLSVEPTLKWLIENGLVEHKLNETFVLSSDFTKLIYENLPELVSDD